MGSSTIFFLSTPVEIGYKPSRWTVAVDWRPQIFAKWTSSHDMSDPRKTNTEVSLYNLTLKWHTITSAMVT